MTKIKTLFKQNIIIILLLLIILLLVIMPQVAISSFYQGLLIWATKVLPALLPFFILTKFLSYTKFVNNFGNKISPITRRIYGVGGVSGYIYLMSIISGYPIGAKLTSDMYCNGIIDKGQACTITSFTSTSGPLFILGTVGIGLFNSSRLGYLLMLVHYLGAIINGFLYRRKECSDKVVKIQSINNNYLSESMSSSIASIMSVGGFIALFYMILNLLISINAFNFFNDIFQFIGISNEVGTAIISGIVEVTSGAISLSQLGLSFNIVFVILSFLISFGGISIHFQAFCFLKNFDMPYSKFLLQKVTQGIISVIVALIVIIFI